MIKILILNAAFYVYGNIRLKEISIFNSFEQIQVNTISGLAFFGWAARPFSTNKYSQLAISSNGRPFLFFLDFHNFDNAAFKLNPTKRMLLK